MKTLFWIFILLGLLSCSSDYGNRVEGGELSVYFTNEKDGEKAQEIAEYMRDKDLLSGVQQDLQLVRTEDGYLLRMIASEPELAKNMSFRERKLLLELQRQFQDSVFMKDKIELVICNNKFEPIYDLNQ
jgi:hypothetical protein